MSSSHLTTKSQQSNNSKRIQLKVMVLFKNIEKVKTCCRWCQRSGSSHRWELLIYRTHLSVTFMDLNTIRYHKKYAVVLLKYSAMMRLSRMFTYMRNLLKIVFDALTHIVKVTLIPLIGYRSMYLNP